MHIDVVLNIPNYYYNQNLLLKFIISKENTFAFRSTCSSVEKTNSPKINMLGSTHYTCSVDTATNIMTVNLKPSGLAIQQSFRFLVGMRNPTVVAQGVDILVYAMQ